MPHPDVQRYLLCYMCQLHFSVRPASNFFGLAVRGCFLLPRRQWSFFVTFLWILRRCAVSARPRRFYSIWPTLGPGRYPPSFEFFDCPWHKAHDGVFGYPSFTLHFHAVYGSIHIDSSSSFRYRPGNREFCLVLSLLTGEVFCEVLLSGITLHYNMTRWVCPIKLNHRCSWSLHP